MFIFCEKIKHSSIIPRRMLIFWDHYFATNHIIIIFLHGNNSYKIKCSQKLTCGAGFCFLYITTYSFCKLANFDLTVMNNSHNHSGFIHSSHWSHHSIFHVSKSFTFPNPVTYGEKINGTDNKDTVQPIGIKIINKEQTYLSQIQPQTRPLLDPPELLHLNQLGYWTP